MLASAALLAAAAAGLAQAPSQGAADSAGPAPGPKSPYWQQEVRYDITARLDEAAGVLAGEQRIVYLNRSPDTLTTFALHLHLNAFRPGSRWADADSVEGRRRFNDLEDPDYGFNHVRDVRIMGEAVTPIYPFAPDSTVVRFELPRPLLPGDSMTVTMDWDARPSTVPRRQGRQGRRFDFAQWYPRVVVYDRLGWQEHPLYPAGEFYGEFGDYLVRLDVPEDQVIGATGVPLCGDPGWERASRAASRQAERAIEYRREVYPNAPSASCEPSGAGRKTVVWYAEDVHHFAMSLNPEYRYEGGRFDGGAHGGVAVHVLYQPGDERSWGGGVAVERTVRALAWLDAIFGPFAWPQVTNVHRIEGGGTEFPMMMHNGSADQGLIVHELGHNYVHGILANNEWREGWLDEGFTSFQSQLFWEAQGRPDAYYQQEPFVLQLDLDDLSEPTSLVSESYRDFNTYNTMIYTRGALFFHQLRYAVGDETMLRIMRTYYDRWKLKHVDEAAFRATAEDVCRCDLSTLFGQWLHSTALYDYGVGRTERRRLSDGGWRTRVEVLRHSPGRIPVEVAVVAGDERRVVRASGLAEREWIEVETSAKPTEIVVDPRLRTHDWNMLNNRKRFGLPVISTLLPPPGSDFYFHPYFATRVRRDVLTVGIQPVAWYNDAGGFTFGLRSRDDYLGRFEQNVAQVTYSTGWESDFDVQDVDFYLRAKNPTFLYAPNLSQTFEAFSLEGRYGGRAAVEWSRQANLGFGPVRSAGAELRWVRADDERYLDPGFWTRAGTLELALQAGISNQSGGWALGYRQELAGGLVHGQGSADNNAAAGAELYGRATLEGTARRPLGAGFALGARAFLGALVGPDDSRGVPRQRLVFTGADPLQTLMNPFLRSRGALFVREDVNYHAPGGMNLRGFDPRLAARGGVAVNVELERALLTRPRARLFSRVVLAAFGDVAVADLPLAGLEPDDDPHLFADAGVGLRAEHRIGDTRFVTRFDLPLYVSRPALAQDADATDEKVGFRWTFSFSPAF